MANVDRPNGLTPIRYLSGAPYNGAVNRYKKEASVILAPGDAVVLSGSAEAVTGIPLVTRAAAGSGTITGVVVAIDPNRGDLSVKHMAAADTGYVLVADDPHLVFEIQEDADTLADSIVITDVGEAGDLVTVADANTTIGRSIMEIDSTNVGTGDNLQVMGLVQREDNVLGAHAKWEVRINEHTFNAAATII